MRTFTRCTPLLVAALLVAACDHTDRTAPPTAVRLLAGESDTGPAWSPWTAPVNLGPLVNSASNDQHPSLSKDGLSLYFVSDRPGGYGGLDIYVTHRASLDAPWGQPANLGPTINTGGTDMAPDLTIDGHHLFYHTDRPGGCGDFDLWESFRQDASNDFGWQTPVNLGCTINGPYRDAGPAYTEEDGDGIPTLYFTSTRPGGFGDFDIYKSKLQSDGTWGPAIHVPELSGPYRDTRIAIARSGLELIISSDATGRPGGIGGQDLWRSTRVQTTDPWSAPVNLGPVVNTTSFDGAPALSFDRTTLFFFSDRPGGNGKYDLYVTTRTRLDGKSAESRGQGGE